MNKHLNKSKQVNNSSLGHSIENEQHTCFICWENFTGYGNNPAPVTNVGRCCDNCNATVVIPARFNLMYSNSKNYK